MSSRERQRYEDDAEPEEQADGVVAMIRRILAHGLTPEERLEELLAERGRELEEYTARLEETALDLERREELLRDSRASLERLLRMGTSDLDLRESDLTRLIRELSAREERLRDGEAELARRRGELGAVELKRAAVEQRELALESREAAIAAREERLAALEPGAVVEERTPPAGASLLLAFVPGATYRLVELEHPAVAVGELLAVGDEEYVVARTGRSPLPGDPRRCAYLLPRPRGAGSTG